MTVRLAQFLVNVLERLRKHRKTVRRKRNAPHRDRLSAICSGKTERLSRAALRTPSPDGFAAVPLQFATIDQESRSRRDSHPEVQINSNVDLKRNLGVEQE
jgi:hypothetical protein